jgi:hypothetical protein
MSRANLEPAAPTEADARRRVLHFRDGRGGTMAASVDRIGDDVVLQLGVNPSTGIVLTPEGARQVGDALRAAAGGDDIPTTARYFCTWCNNLIEHGREVPVQGGYLHKACLEKMAAMSQHTKGEPL